MVMFVDFINIFGFFYFMVGNVVMILVGLMFFYLVIRYEMEFFLFFLIGIMVVFVNLLFFYVVNWLVVVNLFENVSDSIFKMIVYMSEYYGELGFFDFIYYFFIKIEVVLLFIFFGFGVMIDFGLMIVDLKMVFFGVVVQIGVFVVMLIVLVFGFNFYQVVSIGIIGGVDGLMIIYLIIKFVLEIFVVMVVVVYFYMSFVFFI